MGRARRQYPSDLTDQQWESIRSFVPLPRSGGRPRTTDMREVINAILYVVRAGVPWRYLPKEFPPWKTVHHYFSKFSEAGLWLEVNLVLNRKARAKSNRNEAPTLGIIDSQSSRSHYGFERGYDAYKKVRGRKRNIIVDTLGLIWSVKVNAANITDAKGGLETLRRMPNQVRSSLEKIIGDSVYKWPLDFYAEREFGIQVETIDKRKLGTNMKPKRWIVERTFAWFNHFRRLSRDYERKTNHSEAMIYLAMIAILLGRSP